MNSHIPTKATSIVAKMFILRRSGTYQGQMHRNYSVNSRLGQVGALVDALGANRAATVTPSLLGTVGHDLLQLDAGVRSTQHIAVPNGWNNQRGIFLLALDVNISTGGRLVYYVQGYCDTDAFTAHSVDPNLRMYINNVVVATPAQERGPMGLMNTLRVSANYQTPVDFGTAHGFSPNPMVMSRPQDIFGQMKNNDLQSTDVFVLDQSNRLSSNLVSTRRRNNIPTSFLSTMLNAYTDGKRFTQAGDFTLGDVAENSIDNVLDNDALADTFLNKLKEANGLLRGQSHFTFAELARVVPNIDAVKNLVNQSSAGVQLSQMGDSNHFAGQTISTICAVQLANAVPSLMLECMLSSVHIKISNMVSGELDMTPLGMPPACFAPDIMERQYALFRNRLMREVIFPMTERGAINIDANIQCSFHSEFVIDIKVGDDPVTRFVTPTFCDSLYTPTVSNDPTVIKSLADSMSVMCDHVSDALLNNELRKDMIISRSLKQPMSGALSSHNDAFAIPKGVNKNPMAPIGNAGHMGVSSPMSAPNPMAVGSHAAHTTTTTRSSGPSHNSM